MSNTQQPTESDLELVPIQVRLPRAMVPALDATARVLGQSRDEYIRDVLLAHAAALLPTLEAEAQRRGLLRAPHQEYPKVLYHATLPHRIVNDAAEEQAAGPEWFESPSAVIAAAEAKKAKTAEAEVAQAARATAAFQNVRRVTAQRTAPKS